MDHTVDYASTGDKLHGSKYERDRLLGVIYLRSQFFLGSNAVSIKRAWRSDIGEVRGQADCWIEARDAKTVVT